MNDKIIREVAVTAKGKLIAATEENVIFISTDEGKSWSQIGKGIDSWETHKVHARKHMLFVDSWRTSNQGVSWKKIDKLGPGFVITKKGRLLTFRAGEMYASDDDGENWRKVGDIKGDNAFMYVLPDNTVVACIWGGGVWYSTDEGKSWHQYGLGEFKNMDMRIVYSTSSGTLLMSGKGILLRSTNKGKSWNKVGEKNGWGFSTLGGVVYAGTYANGVYKSTDDCLTWAFFNDGLRRPDEYVTVSWLTAGKDNSILCSTLGKGIWILRKDSNRWQPYNEGLGDQLDFWTSYNDANKRLYVAGPGVFVRDLK